jgi:RNA recognition motif-containing protein
MGTKLYVGNLPFNTTENELQELFSQAGAVQEVTLMQDRLATADGAKAAASEEATEQHAQ